MEAIPEPSQEIQITLSTPVVTVVPVDDVVVQVDKKSKIVDLTEEFEDEDDGIEWEPVEVDVAVHDEQEDAPFDAEAARLADIESDLRTNSGWTTVVQK